MNVSQAEIQAAKDANVYDFVSAELADAFIREGTGWRLRSDHKVFVSANSPRYFDNSTGKPGNAIDLLVLYFGYDFVDAVKTINASSPVSYSPSDTIKVERVKNTVFPPAVDGRYSRVYAYLNKSRCIPKDYIEFLLSSQLLYEAAETHNAVFINENKTYAEIRGTNTYKSFKQSLGEKSGNYWSPDMQYGTVFVCEAAIDAVSLWVLRDIAGKSNASYISIGGVANTKAIDNLIAAGKKVILAVDNDDAGNECRAHFPTLPFVIPKNKDWNDDLIKGAEYDGD